MIKIVVLMQLSLQSYVPTTGTGSAKAGFFATSRKSKPLVAPEQESGRSKEGGLFTTLLLQPGPGSGTNTFHL